MPCGAVRGDLVLVEVDASEGSGAIAAARRREQRQKGAKMRPMASQFLDVCAVKESDLSAESEGSRGEGEKSWLTARRWVAMWW